MADGSYNIAGIAVSAVAVAFVVHKLLHWDTKVEVRREHAKQMEKWCDKMGWFLMADIFGAYSIGDYDGMWEAIKTFLKAMADPATRRGILRGGITTQLKLYKTDKEHREIIDEACVEQGLKIIEITKADAAPPQAAS